ncbi:MAG: hypothetical protein M1840_004834 [Geoglossum simile]|nr:MAG: hypothetical protein M1840_004834 [Geoglossum simile]
MASSLTSIKAHIVIASAGGHPIHLHGHDFAVVYQSDKRFSPDDIKSTCPDNKKFRCDNPPRRDVIMPHSGTYVVIAFKTDNPDVKIEQDDLVFLVRSCELKNSLSLAATLNVWLSLPMRNGFGSRKQ